MEFSVHEDRAFLVSRSDSEALLAALERAALERSDGNRRAGVFGPGSMSWRINREAGLFLGAGRAALLQLAHPWVATALEQHSTVMARPIARFHNTFRIVYAMVFGSLDQAMAASRNLYALHTRIRGEMKEDIAAYRRGSHYEANEIGALRWVFATLIESAVLAYECVSPPLTPGELSGFYADSKLLAAMFGLPTAALPEDWAAFLAYCREMEQSNALAVSDSARTMAHNLLAGAGSWIKPPHWYRALTAQWLPQRFRSEFQLDFGSAEVRAVERAKRRLPQIYRKLPEVVRFIGPWHEAADRLEGKRPGMVARVSNRFWIGEACLPFAD